MRIPKKQIAVILVAIMMITTLSGCGKTRQTMITKLVGVSLANLTDEWRIVLKNELEEEARQYPGLKLVFTDAGSDVEKQKKDMRELMDYGAELLIVSPVDVEKLIPEVEDIYHEGMPILLLDRAVKGFDYTCFFGVDDKILVKQEIEAITALTGASSGEKVRILNVNIDNYTGRQRSELLQTAAPDNMEITRITIRNGTRDETEDMLLENEDMLKDVDLILTQNDYMACGAARAIEKIGRNDIKIMGVDGFMGKDGGLEMVKKGLIDATIVCPTGASQALSYAVEFLEGEIEGAKQIIPRNRVVTADNIDDFYDASIKKEKKEIQTVGYVQIDENTGFRKANTQSFSEAAEEYGINLEIKECGTIEEQIKAFDYFLDAGKDAIIVSPMVEDGWDEAFERAKQKGVPVILSDREVSCSEELYTSFVGSDFVEEGARCMRWLEENMQNEGQVRILELEGTKGASPSIDRGNGFRSLLNEQDNFEIIDSINGNFTRDEGYRVVKKYLEKNGAEFDVIFCHNDDMMEGAITAFKEYGINPGVDIKVLSIDGTSEALNGIQVGEVNFVAECTPLLGYNVMQTLNQLQDGKEVPLRVVSSEEIFDASTVDTFFRNRKY